MIVSIELTEEEQAIAKKYVDEHSVTLSDAFKNALFERIEDEYDLEVFNKAYEEYIVSGRQSVSIEELFRMLNDE